MSGRDKVSLSQQKLDLDEARIALEKMKSDIQYKINVLERGMKALDEGEDMLYGEGFLSDGVRRIMKDPRP